MLQGRKCSGIGKEAFSQCATLSSEVQSQGKGKTGDRQERDRGKRLKGEERRNTFPPQVTTDIIRFKLICCLIGYLGCNTADTKEKPGSWHLLSSILFGLQHREHTVLPPGFVFFLTISTHKHIKFTDFKHDLEREA